MKVDIFQPAMFKEMGCGVTEFFPVFACDRFVVKCLSHTMGALRVSILESVEDVFIQ